MTDESHDLARSGIRKNSERHESIGTLTSSATEGKGTALTSSTPEDKGRFWRGLDELHDTPEFLDYLRHEFPSHSDEFTDPAGRRHFLKLMAASLGLAGATGCLRQPEEKIVPYVRQPEDIVPGKPLMFATAMTLGGYATGVLVESHLGRPTKIEGNPEHPASLGATDVFTQASILSLYDPDRSQTVMKGGRISTWGEFLTALAGEVSSVRARKGRGLTILTETVTSPTLADQLRALLRELPEAKWRQYEPAGRDNVRAGAKLAFGEYVDTIYHFDRADVVLTLDADFLAAMPGSVRYARDFIDRRRVEPAVVPGPDAGESDDVSGAGQAGKPGPRNRLFAVESTPGLTGAVADHRLALPASEVESFAKVIAAELNVPEARGLAPAVADVPAAWIDAVVSDLQAHQGTSLVIAGEGQPASVHALAHAMNRVLGNVGAKKTVEYVEPVEAEPIDQLGSLRELADDMRQEEVELLIVLGGNPVYASPGELEFAKHLEQVKFRVHLSESFDETSFVSHWHIPAAHYLEAWGDARAFDGTATIQQPLIAPLYGGRTAHELLAAVAGHPERTAFELLQTFWKARLGEDDFDRRWRKALHDGVVPDTRSPAREVIWSLGDGDLGESNGGSGIRENPERDETNGTLTSSATEGGDASEATDGLELIFGPDPTVWDGRFANNGWLQELPKPLTKLTWDNAALVSPGTAARLKLANFDVVELSLGGRAVRAPIWIVPGHAHNSLTLSLGYGRARAGRIGDGAGVNAYTLRPAAREWFARGVELKTTGEKYPLSVTQHHHSMEGRGLVQVGTLAEFEVNPTFLDDESHHAEQLPSLYPKYEEPENAWGMVIDQTACIGCNACVVACQAENNIPIVGKEQVGIGREMQWLRIDRYYRGAIDAPDAYFQPVACMHCENAPCELVCPVGATVHSHEGLNQMVYNRCVGTRYCSNNCPYKVRRFNFLDYDAERGYDAEHAPVLKLLRNPDVTVRSRGVMEKCTYCVQRINEAKIDAQKQDRPVRDGEVVTACQGACPARAIVFGNLRDQTSQVARLKKSPLNYSLLAELNTLPRTTYLARIRNPHPDLEGPATTDTPPVEPTAIDRFEGGPS
ncbi:MAG TPA: TAT-variant-translocated molybdopterin oxidoreductase [Pirellulales bacterium]|nr:TAT-variant-translocated molybdopterin oxidoreductase [Pirellulales bacterium]